MGDGIGEYRNWRNWYQNEVDKEMEVVSETRGSITKGAISYFRGDDVGGRAKCLYFLIHKMETRTASIDTNVEGMWKLCHCHPIYTGDARNGKFDAAVL